MGYTTYFTGEMEITPEITVQHAEYINAFSRTRRMARDVVKLKDIPDPLRIAVGLPLGLQGSYFVGAEGFKGQDHDSSVIEVNYAPGQEIRGFRYRTPTGKLCRAKPLILPNGYERHDGVKGHNCELSHEVIQEAEPGGQPGLWCQWIINAQGELEWDSGEKFYDYIEWLKYLIDHFFTPWGYSLDGRIYWDGEEQDDFGYLEARPTNDGTSLTVAWGHQSYHAPELVN